MEVEEDNTGTRNSHIMKVLNINRMSINALTMNYRNIASIMNTNLTNDVNTIAYTEHQVTTKQMFSHPQKSTE